MRPEDLDSDMPAEPGLELRGGEATWRKYAGKVIAIVDGEVLASGETWGEAFEAAQRAGLTDPLMFSVPDGAVIA